MNSEIWNDNDIKLRKNIIRFSVLLIVMFTLCFKVIFYS